MEWTKESLAALKREYNKAVKASETQFTFNGQPVLVAFAKYLIEYLETQFKN